MKAKEYTTGYYKSRINNQIKKIPRSIKYLTKQEEIERNLPDPKFAEEFTERLKKKLGDKDYLPDLNKFMSEVNLTSSNKEVLEKMLNDLIA